MDRAGLPQPHLLPRARRGQPLRGLAGAGALRRGAPSRVPVAAAPDDRIRRAAGFAPVKQIEAGDLDVGYADAGPVDGPAVLLLHGWPYDIHSFAEVAPDAGRGRLPGDRALPARLRNDALPLATTRSATASRRPSPLDAVALLDALGDRRGDRRAASTGALGPPTSSRRSGPSAAAALVSVSGYLIGSQEANREPLPPSAELAWWYQFYFATERGRAGYEAYRRDFARLIWQTASPKWEFDDATFDRSAASFDNPDHVDIVIHNYRWRLGLADGEAAFDELEARLAAGSGDRGADDHARRRRERRAPSRCQRLSRRSSRARMRTGSSPAASGTTCPRKPRGPSPTRSSRSTATDRWRYRRRIRQPAAWSARSPTGSPVSDSPCRSKDTWPRSTARPAGSTRRR